MAPHGGRDVDRAAAHVLFRLFSKPRLTVHKRDAVRCNGQMVPSGHRLKSIGLTAFLAASSRSWWEGRPASGVGNINLLLQTLTRRDTTPAYSLLPLDLLPTVPPYRPITSWSPGRRIVNCQPVNFSVCHLSTFLFVIC